MCRWNADKWVWRVVAFALFLPAVVHADSPPPELGSLAAVSGVDEAASARFESAWQLLQASLVAGGCNTQHRIESCRTRFETFWSQQQALLSRIESPDQRAKSLFVAMQAQFLDGTFQPFCYRVDATLAGESHNCLTSTVLFLALCRAADIPAQAMTGPSHVFCRLALDEPVDVQTTASPAWAFQVRPATPSHESPSFQLDDHRLVARIYYNRGTSLLVQREPERAVRYLRRSWEMVPHHSETQRNLIIACNELALVLCDEERFVESTTVLQSCVTLDPDDPMTAGNDVHVHHQWVTHLCAVGRFAEAAEVVSECAERRPEVPFFDQGRWVVYRAWAERQLATLGVAAAADVWAQVRARFPVESGLSAIEDSFWADHQGRL